MEKNALLAVVGPAADQIDSGTNFIEWSIAVIGPTAYQIDFTDLKVIVIKAYSISIASIDQFGLVLIQIVFLCIIAVSMVGVGETLFRTMDCWEV